MGRGLNAMASCQLGMRRPRLAALAFDAPVPVGLDGQNRAMDFLWECVDFENAWLHTG